MKAAVVQINSGTDRSRNIERTGTLVNAAAVKGADLIVLPEKWSLLGDGRALAEGAEGVDGEAITAATSWAADLGVHLLAGSVTMPLEPGDLSLSALPTNTSILISPEGEQVAHYDKLHMFDVEAGGIEYRESDHEQAAQHLAVAEVGDLRVGLTICYDLRFPELYRALLDRGANAFTVPSAFTRATGKDHWEILLRARAIENQAFVLAANQTGKADPTFDSWGHSMIIGPWGEVLARMEEEEGFVCADLDLAGLEDVRRRLPAVEHRRRELFGEGAASGA